MKFFKQNSYDITKLFIYQIGMTVFGLILGLATIMSRDGVKNPLTLVAGIFSACFYLYLVYAVVWDMGARDKIRVEAGRKERDALLGLKLMLIAQIPNMLVLSCMWLGACIYLGNEGLGNMLFGIGQPIAIFTQGMYLGIIMQFFTKGAMFLNATLYTVAILPALLVSALGYYFGLKDIRFLTSPYVPKQ